jgi:deoxyhypusine synthase
MAKRQHQYTPTVPFTVNPEDSVEAVLTKMRNVSFQGRTLAVALDIWDRAVRSGSRIFLGLSGAMVPAGMRMIFVHLIRHRLIHCIVTTGANTFHDLHESLGFHHFISSPFADDVELRKQRYDRMALGLAAAERAAQPGFVIEAARQDVPIFCPAIGDSSIGIAAAVLAQRRPEKKIVFDAVGDVLELTRLVAEAEETGVIFIGGGTPKNFTQQTEVVASLLGMRAQGHRYCIQFSTDAPHWGGLSGCTFEESQSWGKIHFEADKINVYVDATIALPIIVTALTQRLGIKTDG